MYRAGRVVPVVHLGVVLELPRLGVATGREQLHLPRMEAGVEDPENAARHADDHPEDQRKDRGLPFLNAHRPLEA